jgi:lipoyl(octanoyl) transferase
LNTRQFVVLLEDMLIELCQSYGIDCYGDRDAPGVYCDGAKIASIGLRIRKQRSYHGIALNVCNDLTPFQYINPCGYVNQKMMSIQDRKAGLVISEVVKSFETQIKQAHDTLMKVAEDKL